MRRTRLTALFLSLALFTVANENHAGEQPDGGERPISISDQAGHPLPGAMLTATDAASGIRTTVFSDARGLFPTSASVNAGTHWTAFARGYTAQSFDSIPSEIDLSRNADDSSQIPSSEWLALLPDGPEKREFILNCASCHEIGHDRVLFNDHPRNAIEWLAAIGMMRAIDAYDVIPPDFNDKTVAEWLAAHLSPERVADLKVAPSTPDEELSSWEITEYELPQGDSLPHDLVVGPDGRIWITAFFYDQIWALDPDSGAIESFDVDTDPQINDQPRALEFDSTGQLWIVNGGTRSVLKLDPSTGKYTSVTVDMYAHSLAIDGQGKVWINDYFAEKERIAVIDPDTMSSTTIAVPASNRPEAEGLPLPYGLQVTPEGLVFSTQMAANTLVTYDSHSGKSALFEMPENNSGPRRPGLGPDGLLYIPEFNTGHLAIFDPADGTFSRARIGPDSLGAYDAEVNQSNGEVWVTGSLDSSIVRYAPDTGSILRIPFPTEPAYTRHIAVDENSGEIWSAYSSMPAATPRVVRLRRLAN